jgi:hypothetical protein
VLTLTITGTVQELESGAGIGGATLEAHDERRRLAPLAATTSDGTGAFRLVLNLEGREAGKVVEARPSLVFDVTPAGARKPVFSSESLDPWRGEALHDVEIRIPRSKLGRRRPRPALRLLDESLEERRSFEVGESAVVTASGLRRESVYELAVSGPDGEELFADRLVTNVAGAIEPTVVWPQMGLDDLHSAERLSLDEAFERWRGAKLVVELRRERHVVAKAGLGFAETLKRPVLFASDEAGRLLNGFELGEQPAFLSARNVRLANPARVYLVRRQHDWRPGDSFEPVVLASGRPGFVDVEAEGGRFQARVARPGELEPGAYDFIVRELRYGYEDDDDFVLRESDLVVHRRATGLVIRYPFMAFKAVRGGCANYLPISGRAIVGPPYFLYADTFQVGESVYGALDPAALHPSHLSKMVALYVIQHKTAAQWSADKSLNHLAVLGGNAAVQKFLTQPGCINFNKRLLWAAATAGEYDIVADFGNNTANPATFAPDNSFDSPLDIIDGYFVTGFRVVPDPTTDTSFANAGHFSYDETTEGSISVSGDFGSSWTVPLRASVWFPADAPGATTPAQISVAQSSYPLVVVVHGNATQPTSYQGYEYLLEHLAKNGFIAASIHLLTCQYATDRARVLFQHLTILKTKFGAKAANNIGLMGHSRGGEAVTVAARLNSQQALGHGINAVIALAPTDWIVGENYGPPWAVPYLVVYGALDGDVAGGPPLPMETGFSLFDRATGADKSMVFAYGAIHDRFNTVWGDGDLYFGKLGATDLPKVATADAHQKLAKGYMTAFFRQHLKAEGQWAGIFRGEWIPAAVAAADPSHLRLYVQYVDTTKTLVDDFEGVHTPTSWETSTIGGAVADDNSLPVDPQDNDLWTLDAQSPHQTAGLLLRWDGLGDHLRFVIPAPSKNVSGFECLSFRITQKAGSASNPAAAQDLYVTLQDKSGKARSLRVGKFAEIPEPQTREKNQYTKSAMRTVRIPLHVFTIEVLGTDRVDLKSVDSVSFAFDALATGEIEIDSVEFST